MPDDVTKAALPPPALLPLAQPASLPRALRPMLALDDFEHAARRHLPRPVFGYVAGAAETNQSFADNRAAFAEWGFVPRVLSDVSARSQAVSLLGSTFASPFGIAPMGLSALAAYRGDIALTRAAAAARIPMVVSGTGLIRLEDVIAANPDAWFQAYLPGEPARIAALIDRAASAGYRHLVVTVDTCVQANRENNVRNGFSTPLRPSLRLAWDGIIRPRWLLGTFLRTLRRHGMPHFENSYAERGVPVVARNVERDFSKRDHLDWSHLEAIRRRWQGRLVVKGILAGEDAARARAIGADAIIVSNHGGRQLDGAVAPLRALPEVVAAAGGLPVMLDSGIRRGSDVLKAFALGACFVWIGRPMLFAAAIGEEAGVRHAISILQSEIQRNMALLGITRPEAMRPDMLRRIRG